MNESGAEKLDNFNRTLSERNPNLIGVSEFKGREEKINVKCLKCKNVMGHKTPHSWLYADARCYYCDDLSFSRNVESYDTYVERKTEGRISPTSEYRNASSRMKFRCNVHNVEFEQSHSELFRKDGQGGCLCGKCKKNIRKRYTSEELLAIATLYAPNLSFLTDFRTKTGDVQYRCKICGYEGKTAVIILERSKKGEIYCPRCNMRVKKSDREFEEVLINKNIHLHLASTYQGMHEKVDVKCDRCKKTWSYKTPSQWKESPMCYLCDDQPFNPALESYGDFVRRKYGEKYIVLTETWLGAKKNHLYYCKEHGEEFWQTPDNFNQHYASCPTCKKIRDQKWIKERTKDHKEYVKQLRMVSPEIEVLGRYRSSTRPLAVRCTACAHEWAPSAGPLLYQKTKCPICSGAELTAKAFKSRVKKASPGLRIIGKFTRGRNLIKVQCEKCKENWDANKTVLLRGCGCSKCQRAGTSRQELMLLHSIKNLCCQQTVLWRNRSLIKKELDIVIPHKNTAIEIGHYYHHRT